MCGYALKRRLLTYVSKKYCLLFITSAHALRSARAPRREYDSVGLATLSTAGDSQCPDAVRGAKINSYLAVCYTNLLVVHARLPSGQLSSSDYNDLDRPSTLPTAPLFIFSFNGAADDDAPLQWSKLLCSNTLIPQTALVLPTARAVVSRPKTRNG
jgi:hypothetical protein